MSNDFVAGGIAALGAITIMHPVDVVKTRLQFQGEAGKGTKQYGGVVNSLYKIARLEGANGLYRGISAAYMLQATVTATRFGVYGVAGVSGFCGAILGNPWYALKTRAQAFSTAKELVVGTQHNQNIALHSQFRNIYAEEGIKGYFRGIEAFAPRVIAYGAFQLATYDAVKPIFIRRNLEGLQLHACTAFVASCVSVIAIQPFDFIATRLMNQPIDPMTHKGLLYDGPFDCLLKSIRSEGVLCITKGGWANMSRMGPYTVFVLVFFEQVKSLL